MGNLDFHVLGPVEVIADGRVVTIGRGTLTDLLATLIVSPNQVVSLETLTATVWHARSPQHPRAALQSAIARLRRMIGDGFIETMPSGYRFRAEADCLDLLRFEQSLAAADQQQTPEAALAALTQAVGLWRGAPLENVGSPALLNGAVPRLTQLYLDSCEKWAGLCLRTGRHDAVVSRLAALVDAHPFRERMSGQLILGLYRSGRQADAIAAYEALRRALSEEMGIDPGQALQELHLKILRADPSLLGEPDQANRSQRAGSQPARAIPAGQPQSLAFVPRQLPRDLPDFCGRESEMEQLTSLLTGEGPTPGETPVVAISGKGGIGKTALAVQVAHRLSATYCDGQLMANLQGAGLRQTSPESVLADFLQALGVASSAVPQSIGGRMTMFRSLAAGRRLLVVLDNAASEGQVQPLLPASASCAVIITSRCRITGLAGAHLVNLDVLDDTHAIDLLDTIIGRDRVAAERGDAKELVSLCGGLPLALRIVGARLAAKAHWPLAKLADRLADKRHRLNELTHGDLDVRATFSLSYEALDEPTKAMLRRLSLLDAPDFPAWAGAALLGISPGEAADICERLVDVQLLDPATRHPPGEIRYAFHDLVRAFARDLAFVAEPETVRSAALERAFGGWLALAEQAHRYVYGGDYTILHGNAARWTRSDAVQQQAIRRDPVAWLEGERLAILAAIRQSAELGWHELCWDLAWTAVTLYEARGYYDDWQTATEHALAAARAAGNVRGTAAMLTSLASLRVQSRSLDSQMRELVEQALDLFSQLGDLHGCSLARYRLGVIYTKTGQPDRAIHVYRRGRLDAHQVGDAYIEAGILRELASAHLQRGDHEAATDCLTQSLRLHEEIGSLRGKAQTLHTLGELRLRQGDPDAAKAVFQRVLDMIQNTNDIVGQVYVTLGLAEAFADAGLHDQAEGRLLEALRLGRQIRNRVVEDRALRALGQVRAGRPAVRSECSPQTAGSPC
jgi:DNA-binding SARP family transcriptional activator/tetratricopeptide (TPR) repeat protein